MAVFEKTEIIGLHDDNYLKKAEKIIQILSDFIWHPPDLIRHHLGLDEIDRIRTDLNGSTCEWKQLCIAALPFANAIVTDGTEIENKTKL